MQKVFNCVYIKDINIWASYIEAQLENSRLFQVNVENTARLDV